MSTVDLGFDPSDAELRHIRVLLEAARINHERSGTYGDNWRESGWRGALFKLRLRCSRAWDALWNAEPGQTFERDTTPHDVDDLLDVINFAAQTVILVREGDRDGQWRYD
jgi:hypothetical protein